MCVASSSGNPRRTNRRQISSNSLLPAHRLCISALEASLWTARNACPIQCCRQWLRLVFVPSCHEVGANWLETGIQTSTSSATVPTNGCSSTFQQSSTTEVLGLPPVDWPTGNQQSSYLSLESRFAFLRILGKSSLVCSQQFWGNMIARAGAGPSPIPHATLSVRNLAEAIRFCLKPQTVAAAREIAAKMQFESGVTAAVQSFHRHLPLEQMRCQVFPDQVSVWKYARHKREIRLSRKAVQILIDHLKIDPKNLRW